jgi:hypothetical protein
MSSLRVGGVEPRDQFVIAPSYLRLGDMFREPAVDATAVVELDVGMWPGKCTNGTSMYGGLCVSRVMNGDVAGCSWSLIWWGCELGWGDSREVQSHSAPLDERRLAAWSWI